MAVIKLALHAMATRFELVAHGGNAARLRAAGEEALAEIERLEDQLSLYRPGSDIARLNALAAKGPVRVTPTLFALLQHARQLHHASDGAFDITIGPLVRCWGFMGGEGGVPRPDALAAARACVGMSLVELDAGNSTVRFAREGVMLDLGALGKGYALERAVDLLREAGVTSALLHSGTSSVCALGSPPDAQAWQVAVPRPRRFGVPPLGGSSGVPFGVLSRPARDGSASPGPPAGQPQAGHPGHEPRQTPLAIAPLRDESLSVSAVWGRWFESEGKVFGHVLDPRTGCPVSGAVMAVVVLPSASETDALSTALLVLGREGPPTIARARPGAKTLVVLENKGTFQVEASGIALWKESNTDKHG